MNAAEKLICEVASVLAPPPELTVSQWADRYRYLSSETAAEPGKWHTLSFQREPMDAVSDPRVRRVVIKSARQMLKTSTLENALGYFAHQDPGPILLLQPGGNDAKDFSKERIAPMIRDTPALREIFGDQKSRSSENTMTEKMFRGGMLAIAGAGSIRNLIRRSVRILLADEVDNYKVTSQGSVLPIARKCLATFRHRAKEVYTCSPTLQGSTIDKAYEESDRREYYVPCHACGHRQSMMSRFFTNVRWNSELPTREEQALTARYHCENKDCEIPWNDAQRWSAVDAGEWRAHAPFTGVAGFWISELYSPWKRLSEIVLDFLVKKDDRAEYQTFWNTSLAENWTEPGEQLEWRTLVDRREEYEIGTIPAGGLLLAAGVDVQREDGGRLELEVLAVGRNRETWSVDYQIFHGNPAEPAVWAKLEAYSRQTFRHASGVDLAIQRMFVDSGDGTTTRDVYEWVAKQPRPAVWAIKGDGRNDQPVSMPKTAEQKVNGRVAKYGVLFKSINVNYFKAGFYADLRKRPPTEEERAAGLAYPQGYCHFPVDITYGDEHFRQICSEQLQTNRDRRGRAKMEWTQLRPRNEALDCRVYALAAAWDLGVHRLQERHWKELERRTSAAPEQAPVAPPPKPIEDFERPPNRRDPRVVRSSYIYG